MNLDLKLFKTQLQEELVNILRYWKNNAVDKKYGGFLGKIDHYNRIIEKGSKGAVLNARILWTFSIAYNFTHDRQYLGLAERAYQYLVDHFWDKEYGGLFWELDYHGNVLNDRKQIYAQGFGVYGFSEFYKASGSADSLKYAIQLYELIERHAFDTVHGGYIEALGGRWETLEDMRLSPKDANEPKSMNTHLHLLEPYTNLYRYWKDKTLRNQTTGLVNTFLDKIIDHSSYHFQLFFAEDWSVRSAITSYGHDIEGSWLMYEAAEVLEDQILLEKVKETAIHMVDVTMEEGMDNDGSIVNEKDSISGHTDRDKHWWPQAETMVGLMNAYEITKNDKYLETLVRTWKFISEKLIDKKNGEWFWRVDGQGNPVDTEDKAGFWKCPYHNSRALIEILTRLAKNNLI
jgi:cellobiose epimerase